MTTDKETPCSFEIDLVETTETMRTTATLCLLALALGACEQADPAPDSPVRPAVFDEALGRMDFARASDATAEEALEGTKASLEAMSYVAREANDWTDAHALAQAAIEDARPGVVRGAVGQAMAKLLITAYLVPNKDQEGTAEVALAYSRALVESGSPEAGTVLRAAETFGPTWGEVTTQAIAVSAAEAAEAYVARSSSCVDCEMPREAQEALSESGRSTEVTNSRHLNAARQLRALAESS